MNTIPSLAADAEVAFRGLFEEIPQVRVTIRRAAGGSAGEPELSAVTEVGRAKYTFHLLTLRQLSPRRALAAAGTLGPMPRGPIPVIYAPVISPRSADILKGQGIGYLDRAGNCWLRSPTGPLLIERQGFRNERQPTPAAADPFAPRSSRIVRALLARPAARWRVRELAAHTGVDVSPGLVVKVKRALIEEGFAVETDGRLWLRDPVGLLEAWCQKYPGPAETIPLYLRGDTHEIEKVIGRWCRDRPLQHALAGFSAAWRLAPEVRYAVPAIYLDESAFDGNSLPAELTLQKLLADTGARRVESGPNLTLLRPYDSSVFVGVIPETAAPASTSALQTYLDLRWAGGRGEEAARSVFDRYLRPAFDAAGSGGK